MFQWKLAKLVLEKKVTRREWDVYMVVLRIGVVPTSEEITHYEPRRTNRMLKPEVEKKLRQRAESVVEGYVFSCHLFEQALIPKVAPIGMIADIVGEIRKEVWGYTECRMMIEKARNTFQSMYEELLDDERIGRVQETEEGWWYRPTLVMVRVKGDKEVVFSVPKYEMVGDVVDIEVRTGDVLHRAFLHAREVEGFEQMKGIEIVFV